MQINAQLEKLLESEQTYFPLEKPLYEVTPSLRSLGFDFGLREWNHRLLHMNDRFRRFWQNKLTCRQENAAKYTGEKDLNPSVKVRVASFICHKLSEDYPVFFSFEKQNNEFFFKHKLLEANIRFRQDGTLVENGFPCDDLLDAVVLGISEDVAITQRNSQTKQDWLSYVNVCSPSHWDPIQKLGKNFAQVHAPVANNEKLIKAANSLVTAMIEKGPYARFIWSFVTDTRLNHHPIPPIGQEEKAWRGRSFKQDAQTPFWLRIERQTTTGFPELSCSLFTIGVSFIPCHDILANDDHLHKLIGALESMNNAGRQYKGVASCYEELLGYLKTGLPK